MIPFIISDAFLQTLSVIYLQFQLGIIILVTDTAIGRR